MKRFKLILLILISCSIRLYSQVYSLVDHNTSMTLSPNRVNDTLFVINTTITNNSKKVIYIADTSFYYRRSVVNNSSVYLHFNIGIFNDYYGQQEYFAPLIKVIPFQKIELSDTICIAKSILKKHVYFSYDYIDEDVIKKGHVKINNSVKVMPFVYFVKIEDYKMFGKYLRGEFELNME